MFNKDFSRYHSQVMGSMSKLKARKHKKANKWLSVNTGDYAICDIMYISPVRFYRGSNSWALIDLEPISVFRYNKAANSNCKLPCSHIKFKQKK